jgi:transposase
MAITDKNSLPVAISMASASPHEITLVEETINRKFTKGNPKKLIGDKAYDSDACDEILKKNYGIDLISPHKSNRKRRKTQDGRPLRRYRKRWLVERFNAWIQNFRRIVVRYEYYAENYEGFVLLGCIVILLRNYF